MKQIRFVYTKEGNAVSIGVGEVVYLLNYINKSGRRKVRKSERKTPLQRNPFQLPDFSDFPTLLLILFPFVQRIIIAAAQAVVIIFFITLTHRVCIRFTVIGIRNIQVVAGAVFIRSCLI